MQIAGTLDLWGTGPISPFHSRGTMFMQKYSYQLKVLRQVLAGLFFFPSFFLVPNCFASSAGVLPEFAEADKVLILAPQPDDETIGAGGVIQRAIKAGAKVKVVLLTNGENNVFSFMVYKKRLFFGPKGILRMGEVRRQETLKAMSVLGLAENDVVSLGYPDRGTLEIMTRHWGHATPYRSASAHVTQVPYPQAMSPGAPYTGESILKDLEQILSNYKPTKIIVSHPADANRDHRALYLFLRVALWDLDGKIAMPEIYPCLTHAAEWPKPRGYYPSLKLMPPIAFSESDIDWLTLSLTPEEITNKYNAIQDYPSQIKYAPKLLISFARENELFGDYPMVAICQEMPLAGHRPTLSYAREGNDLLVRLISKRTIFKKLGVALSLLPYKKGVFFSDMPKIEVKIGIFGVRAKNQVQDSALKGVRVASRGKEIEFRIPLALLGNPDFILSSAKTALKGLTVDEMAWRVLSLESFPAVEQKEDK